MELKRTEQRTRIIKERVIEALQEKGETQKGMCDYFGVSPQYFSRCLKNGWISTIWMEAIGQYLDRAPEWLSGKTDAVAPGSVFRYSFHQYQDMKLSDPLKFYMISLGLTASDYSREDFWELDERIRKLINDWAHEQRGKKNGNDQRG